MRKKNIRHTLRLLGIVVLVTLSAGMICYSAHSVRYPVDGVPTSELTITDLSLTHSIERSSDGELTNPYAEETMLPAQPIFVVASATPLEHMSLISAFQQDSVQDLAAKKAKPKKPSPKKPSPKKPKKKPGNGKACPT
ncbi:MAG: hypothetical protein ABFD54_13895 [Armatimonadota bacterium]|nr:hypothetical protein [bacterium]